MGFGSLALSALLSDSPSASAANEGRDASQPLSPRAGHFRPRAKSIIFLFMEGGVSQVDSFDYKPLLNKRNGEDPRRAIGNLAKTQFDNVGLVMDSPWRFRRHGQSGLWASDLFPHMAGVVDDLCFIRSMTSKFPEHTSANYFLHSGFGVQGRPSLGSWMTYGLGSENENLPGYVVVNGGLIPFGGPETLANGFLPAAYQASLLNARGMPLANIVPAEAIPGTQETKRKLVRTLNQLALDEAGPVDALESAIANYELAAGMQVAVPELVDLTSETAATQHMYGLDSEFEHTRTYGRACLIARRLVERGVRFIELTIPLVKNYERWDAHYDIIGNHAPNARAVDQPIAALIRDLKQRSLLDETLVVWTGEFGRTPFAQGARGRDHNESGFTLWMAGGGVQRGIVYGSTDEWGYRVVDKPLEIHDLHATILHLMGIDHTRLTYNFGGRDMRLTDVYGHVIDDILT
jgi:hypothetical protein